MLQRFWWKYERASVSTLVACLIWAWVVVAAASALAAAFRLPLTLLPLVLLIPAMTLLLLLARVISAFQKRLSLLDRSIVIALAVILTSHFLQVWVPETGFDAVWYHLPVMQAIITHGFITSPDLYQLLYPLWSDMVFLPGFLWAGDGGTKLVAFGGVLTLLAVTYVLARQYVGTRWSLLTILLVATFQVLAWQAASFYIDVFMAVWILAAFWFLISAARYQRGFKQTYALIGSAVWLGLAIGSKHFNLVLIVPFAIATLLLYGSFFAAALSSLVALLVASPWYLHAFIQTGQPLYPAFTHLSDLTTDSNTSTIEFFLQRAVSLPISFVKVGFVRDYVTPLLILLLPSIYILYRRNGITRSVVVLLSLIATQWLLWWFIPPFSTRYTLAGFIAGVVVLALAAETILKTSGRKNPLAEKILIATWLAFCLVAFMPRLVVNTRSLTYLVTNQSKQEYVEQFYDGNADTVLKRWHGTE